MNRSIWILVLLAGLSLTACDKPTVVNVPAPTVAVPGPTGPAGTDGTKGDTGAKGNTGNQGDTGVQGDTGEGTTVIVVPPAEPTAN